jgi:ABC-type branched-subunit amino acid transport system ATPase component
VAFKGVRALNNVDISVRPGQVFGLLGPNGAGKSTLLGVLSGLRRPNAGEVYIDGVSVTGESAQRRAVRGLARTFQHPQLFADLTVRDHLRLAHRMHHDRSRLWTDPFTGKGLRAASTDETRVVDELLGLLELTRIADRTVVGLPLGTSRLVEVGQSLATEPSVLLLDEPSSGLDPHETDRLMEALRHVAVDRGVALLLVEHDVELVMGVSDVIQVLEFGNTIAVGAPAEVRANAAVRSAYLGDQFETAEIDPAIRPALDGGELLTATPRSAQLGGPPAEPILRLTSLCVRYGDALALDDVSFEVPRGSVLALLGANGAGKSTVGRVLAGLVPSSSGTVSFDDRDITTEHAHEIRRQGLAYLPEGRGVFAGLSVVENLKLAARTLPKAERADAVDSAIAMFPIFGERRRQTAGQLSGGEQQMLSLARALAVRPTVVVADEMSLGLAPKIVEQVFDALDTAVRSGITLVIIEQLVHRALAMADECCILRRGKLVWAGPAGSAGEEALEHYLGGNAEAADTDG